MSKHVFENIDFEEVIAELRKKPRQNNLWHSVASIQLLFPYSVRDIDRVIETIEDLKVVTYCNSSLEYFIVNRSHAWQFTDTIKEWNESVRTKN